MTIEDILKTEFVDYINSRCSKDLPKWTESPIVLNETVSDKVFDIIDLRNESGDIKKVQGEGDATYFNGGENKTYILCFIMYEKYLNQFKIVDAPGEKEKDWTKGMKRADYLVYDKGEDKEYFIVHELSSGSIKNKRKDGKIQLLNTVLDLYKQSSIKSLLNTYKQRLCFLSAKGCVTTNTPYSIANSFMEIYKLLPEPIPFHNVALERRGFKAFESNVIRL